MILADRYLRSDFSGEMMGMPFSAGVGIGHIFGNYLSGALRNPTAAAGQRGTLFLGFAFAEATGLIGDGATACGARRHHDAHDRLTGHRVANLSTHGDDGQQ